MTFHHLLHQGDARDLSFIPSESVHLVVTSPPYWNLKEYDGDHAAQLGDIEDYEAFLVELNKVCAECLRILIPGGRVVCVVGDVVVSRKEYGRHLLFPLHSDIQVACRRMGFDNLNPIIWHKIANAKYEVDRGGGGGFLGKPFEPNGIVKNDMEYILMFRKGGAYRQPTPEQRELSRIPKEQYGQWFQQIWNLPGASLKHHPAPYPLELATRLVLMFSFYGDTVVDPFSGSGTTMLAAIENNRNSIGIELNPDYCKMAYDRLKGLSLLGDHVLKVEADWAKEKLAS